MGRWRRPRRFRRRRHDPRPARARGAGLAGIRPHASCNPVRGWDPETVTWGDAGQARSATSSSRRSCGTGSAHRARALPQCDAASSRRPQRYPPLPHDGLGDDPRRRSARARGSLGRAAPLPLGYADGEGGWPRHELARLRRRDATGRYGGLRSPSRGRARRGWRCPPQARAGPSTGAKALARGLAGSEQAHLHPVAVPARTRFIRLSGQAASG